jgi:hypothetical protein
MSISFQDIFWFDKNPFIIANSKVLGQKKNIADEPKRGCTSPVFQLNAQLVTCNDAHSLRLCTDLYLEQIGQIHGHILYSNVTRF